MKKLKKITALVLVFVICLSFSSCSVLRDIKKVRAEYKSDEKNEIVFKDNTYVLFSEVVPEYVTTYPLEEYGHITEDQVPLLLGGALGESMRYSEKNDSIVEAYNSDILYVKKQLYDYAVNVIQYSGFDEYCTIIFSLESGEVVERVSRDYVKLTNKIVNEGYMSEGPSNGYDSVPVYATDEKNLFMVHIMDVLRESENDDYWLYVEGNQGMRYYKVPESDEEKIAQIFERYDYHNPENL